MNARHVSEATMRVRDVLYEGLLVRRGEALTEEIARERANNLATQVIEALTQLAEESKPPPVRSRYHFDERPDPNDDDERIKP
jgi:hypothetical protein